MVRTHLLIDLEGTLIDTSSISRFYFTSGEGRNHLSSRSVLQRFGTTVFDRSYVLDLVRIAKDAKVTFVTNAPGQYAQELLDLHGFSSLNYGLVSSANKPTGNKMSFAVNYVGIPKDRCIVVGDSPHDILAAHDLGIRSIGVSWGFFSGKKVLLSEPTVLLDNPLELMDVLDDLGDLEYSPRQKPLRFSYMDEEDFDPTFDPEIEILDLGTYHPTWSLAFTNSFHSKRILDIKAMKDYSFSLVSKNEPMKYFWNGSLRNGRNAGAVFISMKDKISEKIDDLNLSGQVYVHGLTNSLPASCYHNDVLRNLAHNVTRDYGDSVSKLVAGRLVQRTYPKKASHNSGNRSIDEHFDTMGIDQKHLGNLASGSGTIVLIDDVVTTGSSFLAAANLLRNKGFGGNLYGIALGKTDGY